MYGVRFCVTLLDISTDKLLWALITQPHTLSIMRIKIKSRAGSSVISCTSDQVPLNELVKEIKTALKDSISGDAVLSLKNGFPPNPIDMSRLETPIKELNIKNGDQLILEDEGESSSNDMKESKLNQASGVQQSKVKSDPNIPSVYIESLDKYLILRNIPDDNSCMFNSISYGLFGYNSFERDGISPPSNLRSIISSTIQDNQDTYSEVVLGRPIYKYCQWILKKDSWGGAIELGILAEWFKIRIDCLDIELGKFIKFENEADKPDKFMVLIYLGIHYDILSLNVNLSTLNQDKQTDTCVWPIDSMTEEFVLDYSLKLCHYLQTQNYSTNTTTFRIRCLDCYKILVGEMGASKHANETGHYNFGEVK